MAHLRYLIIADGGVNFAERRFEMWKILYISAQGEEHMVVVDNRENPLRAIADLTEKRAIIIKVEEVALLC